jgi:selenocysteine lyase/cysteine desulfurase
MIRRNVLSIDGHVVTTLRAIASSEWKTPTSYLNTASYGLPPQSAFDALQSALSDWRVGRTSWEPWAESAELARATFARLHNVAADSVAIGATVSELVGLLATSVPAGTTVLGVDDDFASLLHPWAAQQHRGIRISTVPLADFEDSITEEVDVVVVSAVQSSTGELAPIHSISHAARTAGARLVIDSTQASGWLPIDASCADALVCAGYKWLLAPRGTAYLYLGEGFSGDQVVPVHAGWYAGSDFVSNFYGLPTKLASSSRRLDTSPAWFSWVGAAPALETLETVGIAEIGVHNVSLANRFREGIGLSPSDSAIVSVEMPGAAKRLERLDIRAATRAGSLRVSFHIYNTTADVDAAVNALTASG